MDKVPNPLETPAKLNPPELSIAEQMADFLGRLDAQKADFVAELEAQLLRQAGESFSDAPDVEQQASSVGAEGPQTGGGGPAVAALVRAQVAAINDAPSNFHQVTAAVCLDSAVSVARKRRYLVSSFVIVALQLLALSGVIIGTEKPACIDSSDCPVGDFCQSKYQQQSGLCQQCADEAEFLVPHLIAHSSEYDSRFWLSNITGYTLWTAMNECLLESGLARADLTVESLDWDGEHFSVVDCVKDVWESMTDIKEGNAGFSSSGNRYLRSADYMFKLNARYLCRDHRERDLSKQEQAYCAGCFDEDSPGNDFNTARSEEGAAFRAMSLMNRGECEPYDRVCVCVCVCVCVDCQFTSGASTVRSGVTLQLVAFITGLYIAGEIRDIKLTQFLVQQRATQDTEKWITKAFGLLAAIRQFTFLPLLTTTIVKLVMWNGSTAIEICFNTVRPILAGIPCCAPTLLSVVVVASAGYIANPNAGRHAVLVGRGQLGVHVLSS